MFNIQHMDIQYCQLESIGAALILYIPAKHSVNVAMLHSLCLLLLSSFAVPVHRYESSKNK